MTMWLDEPLAAGLRRRWRVDEVLWQADTGFQRVLIGRTAQGVSLFCDEERQSTELSQLVYHEALLVPALLLAEAVRRVLVIGSGEGVVSQLAVAAGASAVDHVDIDRECVRRCAQLLPYGYGVDELDTAERGSAGPVRVHYLDGWDFVQAAGRRGDRYDVIVVDLPDEREGAAHERLYGLQFLEVCRALLTPGGVLASQAGCPTLWRNDTLRRSLARFQAAFGTVVYYGSDEQEWAFLFGRTEVLDGSVDLMIRRLPACPYRPATLDADALRRGSFLPYSLRVHGATAPPDRTNGCS
jgi:spermidine synthase